MRDPTNRTRMLVRWTRESGESPGHGKNLLSRQEQEKDRIWKVAVFLKDCFHARQILRAMKIGHWKSCHGSERRLKQCVCARRILRTWMDKSEDLQTPKRKKPVWKSAGQFDIQDTKAMVGQSSFFWLQNRSFHPLPGGAAGWHRPMGQRKSIDMRKKHEPERTERTLRPVGQNARKSRHEGSCPLLSGETAQKTGKTRAA